MQRDTIVVTYYNAPNSDLMKKHYENMPEKLSSEGIKPTIPWLYDFKLPRTAPYHLLFTNEDFNIRLPAAGRDLGFYGDLFDSVYGGLGSMLFI